MRRTALFAALLGSVALLGACSVPSVHGLHSPDVAFDDAGMEGTWVSTDGDVLAKIDRSEQGTFVVSAVLMDDDADKPGRPTVLEARLVKLGKTVYADLVLAEETRSRITHDHNFLAVRTHQFLKVQREGDELRVAQPDYDRMRSLLESGRSGLAHARLDQERGGPDYLITAPTPDLQAFFREHAESPGFFGDPLLMRRVRP